MHDESLLDIVIGRMDLDVALLGKLERVFDNVD